MRKLHTISYFGGSEILKIGYPQVINSLDMYDASLKNNSFQISLEDFVHSELLVDGFIKFSDSPLFSITAITIPIKKISAFLKENIAIYFPNTENDNFWFDLLSLDYLYSLGFLKCCVILLPNTFIENLPIRFDKFLTIVNTRNFYFPKFPMHIAFEQVN